MEINSASFAKTLANSAVEKRQFSNPSEADKFNNLAMEMKDVE